MDWQRYKYMTTLVALNSKTHNTVNIDATKIESHAGTLNMVPVVVSEFLKLSLQYPIVITKNQDNGRFTCVTLFGLEKGENLFVRDQKWDSLYLPLQIRRQPFFLGKADSEDVKLVICIDMSHPSVADDAHNKATTSEKLFDAQGNETNYLSAVKNILAELFDGEKQTQGFINELLAMNLLQPMQLQITLENQSSVRVDGLYTINEKVLSNLTSDQLFSLHQKNCLQPIYTMISSVGHIYGLVDRKNKLSSSITCI
jgi:hypothetical protein